MAGSHKGAALWPLVTSYRQTNGVATYYFLPFYYNDTATLVKGMWHSPIRRLADRAGDISDHRAGTGDAPEPFAL